jgi:hypothetical protein
MVAKHLVITVVQQFGTQLVVFQQSRPQKELIVLALFFVGVELVVLPANFVIQILIRVSICACIQVHT